MRRLFEQVEAPAHAAGPRCGINHRQCPKQSPAFYAWVAWGGERVNGYGDTEPAAMAAAWAKYENATGAKRPPEQP